jgi:vacuolar protein sorting-associated protein 72
MGKKAMTYPRRPRNAQRRLTQADLIAIALQTEESNIESLRIWLEEEEERKRINKIARKVVAGPRISWISRRVDAGPVSVVEDAKGNERATKNRKRKGKDVETEAGSEENAKTVHTGEGELMNSLGAKDSQRDANAAPDSIEGGQRKHGDTEELGPRIAPTATTSAPGRSEIRQTATLESQDSPAGKSSSPAIQPSAAAPSTGTLPSAAEPTASTTPAATTSAAQPLATGSMPSRNDMKPLESAQDRPYERNYVILSSIQGQANELRVLFGDHADWTALKRIPIKHRPMRKYLPRPVNRCYSRSLTIYRPTQNANHPCAS